MKRTLGFAILLGLMPVFSPKLDAQDRDWDRSHQPRDGACFYMDADYRGEHFCLAADERVQNVEDRYNDRVSSIRIFGRAQVTVYEDEDSGGASRTFTRDVPNLHDWNDRISSVSVRYSRTAGPRGGDEPQPRACFYSDADYRGDRLCANSGERVQNVGERYNDKFSSIRLYGGAEVTVYEDEDFRGASQTFREDVPNLRDWNDRITSFEVAGGRYGGGISGHQPRNGACFFMDVDFSGDSFCMNAGDRLPNVGERYNDRISSIRVFGRARVIAYDDENFGGASRTFDRAVSNLGDFNDRITSIEVR